MMINTPGLFKYYLLKHSNTHQKYTRMRNSNSWNRKVFIHMVTWTALISLMKNYKEEMNFTAFFKMSTYPMSNTNMLKMCGIHSIARQSVSIMICILNQIFFCLLMYLRISEILVCYIINLIHVIILHFLNCLGMLYWKINEWYEIIINDRRWYVSIYWQRSEGWYLVYFKHNSHPSNHWNTLR